MKADSGNHRILPFLTCLGATFLTAVAGAAASVQAGPFYLTLVRPPWAPPAYLFAPVWALLYCLMASAAWVVWTQRGFREARLPLGLYLAQLLANVLWTWLFFHWRLGAAAFVEALVLGGLILATLVAFGRVRPLAGALLLPCLGWVAFAARLTWAVWRRNPGVLG